MTTDMRPGPEFDSWPVLNIYFVSGCAVKREIPEEAKKMIFYV